MNNPVDKFIQAEDALDEATRTLRSAKEELIEHYIERKEFDMFKLDVARVYRANGIQPKGRR